MPKDVLPRDDSLIITLIAPKINKIVNCIAIRYFILVQFIGSNSMDWLLYLNKKKRLAFQF